MMNSNSKKFSIKRWEEYLARKHSIFSIILIYGFVLVITSYLFTFFLPLLMGYPPDVIEYAEKYSLSYTVQVLIMLIPALLIGSSVLMYLLKDFKNWEILLNKDDEASQNKIIKIRKKCITYPYIIYIIQVFITVFIVGFIFLFISISNQTDLVVVFKLIIIVFSLFSVVGIISLIFSKRIFTFILLNTCAGEENEGIRISIKNKMLMQMMPLIIVAILITSLVGLSKFVDERGENLFIMNKQKLMTEFNNFENIQSEEELIKILNNIQIDDESLYFYKSPSKDYITSNGEKFTDIFKVFIEDFAPKRNGRAHDEIGLYNAAILNIYVKGEEWIVGLKYKLTSSEAFDYFIYNFIILFMICLLVMLYVARATSNDISIITQKFADLAEGEDVDLDYKLPVISNDELGDLTIAFNKIQAREKMHIENIKTTNEMMMEQERFVSLGQLIGGIAHNMRTPIMSISGAMRGLEKLIEEYKKSIIDKNVTEKDHLEIAGEMKIWVGKVLPHCAYMSDILTAVKDQTAISSKGGDLEFKLEDLVKSIELLMGHELKINNCNLNTEYNIDRSSSIKGDITNMVQIISNLISNSIQAYGNNTGDIDFILNQKEDKVEMIIRDYGSGIPDEIKEKLFKQMITTKGKKGTGLGLYMTNSSIKAKFKGEIRVESEENKGTSFYISIPLLK